MTTEESIVWAVRWILLCGFFAAPFGFRKGWDDFAHNRIVSISERIKESFMGGICYMMIAMLSGALLMLIGLMTGFAILGMPE